MGSGYERMVSWVSFVLVRFFWGWGDPFARAENIDIQSWVQNRRFRAPTQTRNGQEITTCPTKKGAH